MSSANCKSVQGLRECVWLITQSVLMLVGWRSSSMVDGALSVTMAGAALKLMSSAGIYDSVYCSMLNRYNHSRADFSVRMCCLGVIKYVCSLGSHKMKDSAPGIPATALILAQYISCMYTTQCCVNCSCLATNRLTHGLSLPPSCSSTSGIFPVYPLKPWVNLYILTSRAHSEIF